MLSCLSYSLESRLPKLELTRLLCSFGSASASAPSSGSFFRVQSVELRSFRMLPAKNWGGVLGGVRAGARGTGAKGPGPSPGRPLGRWAGAGRRPRRAPRAPGPEPRRQRLRGRRGRGGESEPGAGAGGGRRRVRELPPVALGVGSLFLCSQFSAPCGHMISTSE